jgi:hypothetical protein
MGAFVIDDIHLKWYSIIYGATGGDKNRKIVIEPVGNNFIS